MLDRPGPNAAMFSFLCVVYLELLRISTYVKDNSAKMINIDVGVVFVDPFWLFILR